MSIEQNPLQQFIEAFNQQSFSIDGLQYKKAKSEESKDHVVLTLPQKDGIDGKVKIRFLDNDFITAAHGYIEHKNSGDKEDFLQKLHHQIQSCQVLLQRTVDDKIEVYGTEEMLNMVKFKGSSTNQEKKTKTITTSVVDKKQFEELASVAKKALGIPVIDLEEVTQQKSSSTTQHEKTLIHKETSKTPSSNTPLPSSESTEAPKENQSSEEKQEAKHTKEKVAKEVLEEKHEEKEKAQEKEKEIEEKQENIENQEINKQMLKEENQDIVKEKVETQKDQETQEKLAAETSSPKAQEIKEKKDEESKKITT